MRRVIYTLNSWVVFFFVLAGFFLANHFVKQSLWGIKEWDIMDVMLRTFSYRRILNSPEFWDLSIGMTLRISLEILITATLLRFGLALERLEAPFVTLLKAASLSALILLLQFLIEYLILFHDHDLRMHASSFAFLSVDYMLGVLDIAYPDEFQMMFQSLNLFEIARYALLIWLLTMLTALGFRRSSRIVLVYCVFPLFAFLLMITFFKVINA